MEWKFEAIEKLKQYDARKKSLDNIPAEIARLKEDVCRIRSATGDGSPMKGGSSSREDMLLSNIVHREELERAYDQARRWIALVDAGLEILTKEERLLLDLFYVHPARGNIDRLCAELGVEQASVYRKRDAALRRFTLALYGCTEN